MIYKDVKCVLSTRNITFINDFIYIDLTDMVSISVPVFSPKSRKTRKLHIYNSICVQYIELVRGLVE